MQTQQKCYQCTSLLSQFQSHSQLHCISYSCNHQLCPQCLIHNLIKTNLSFLSNIKANADLTFHCKCTNQGTTKISNESFFTILFSIIESQSDIIKCQKHSLPLDTYCKDCKDSHCPLCIISLTSSSTPKHPPITTNKTQCLIHNEIIDAYCSDCKCSICPKCLSNEHYNHKHKPLSAYRDKIMYYKDNLKYDSFANFEKYLNDKEAAITSTITTQIEYTSDTITALIVKLQEMKSNIIKDLYESMKSIGLLFKIVKMMYVIYYKDIEMISKDIGMGSRSGNSNNVQVLKYLSHTNSIVSEININFIEPKTMLNKIQLCIEEYLNEERLSYVFSYKNLDKETLIAKSIKKKELIECDSTILGHTWSVQSLLYLTNGLLASSSTDTTIKIWDVNRDNSNSLLMTIKGHTEAVYSLIQLRNGNIASSSKDKTIKVWTINQIPNDLTYTYTYTEVYSLKGHTQGISTIIELDDGRIASGSFDFNIIIWDTQLKKEDITLIGHKKFVYCLIQLPNKHIASGSYKEIKVWSNELKKEEYCLLGHSEWVYTLVMLKDNKMASGSYDKAIKVWNLDRREQEYCLLGHTQAVSALIYTEDERLISASWDKTIKIWDLNNKKEEITLMGHTNEVLCLAISKSNDCLASGSDDTTIKLWMIN